MALNTLITESQISELHRLTRDLVQRVAGLLIALQPTDGLYSGLVAINEDLATMVFQLKRAEARVVKERLQDQAAAIQAEIAAQDAIIVLPPS